MNQSTAVMKSILDKIKTSILLVGGGAGFKVKLAQAPFTPNPDSVPSTDFTEATYTGYAAATVLLMTGDQKVGNSWESSATTLAAFAPTGTAVGNSILGYWLEDNTGGFLGWETFPAPIAMQDPSNAINIVCRWQVQPINWPNTVLP